MHSPPDTPGPLSSGDDEFPSLARDSSHRMLILEPSGLSAGAAAPERHPKEQRTEHPALKRGFIDDEEVPVVATQHHHHHHHNAKNVDGNFGFREKNTLETHHLGYDIKSADDLLGSKAGARQRDRESSLWRISPFPHQPAIRQLL